MARMQGGCLLEPLKRESLNRESLKRESLNRESLNRESLNRWTRTVGWIGELVGRGPCGGSGPEKPVTRKSEKF